ncbi:MAG: FAD-dependent oxidoreductase [Clostridia bacterium]
MSDYEIIIIGGGPAGLAAAISAYENGVTNILVLERDNRLGGILNQCIHNGFGLHTFKEELTGPEYSARYEERLLELNISYKLNIMVVDISENVDNKIVTAISKEDGLVRFKTKAVVLAMGCRERSRGALNIPGYRPSGVYSAGTAQRLVNIDGYMPGKEVVILGSGDIGLIMARRMTLEGAKVKIVAEIMPYSGGLKRNIVQCLDDYNIPLKLSHTVTKIHGKDRVEGVTISEVDQNLKPITGTDEFYSCDTLLLSVGLIPENELSKDLGVILNPITAGAQVNESFETSVKGVFACGNVLHVHDLVDFVSAEASSAGINAANYAKGIINSEGEIIDVEPKNGVRYVVPHKINLSTMPETVTLRFRVNTTYHNKYLSLYIGENRNIHRKKQILLPGEMESLTIKKTDLINQDINKITVMLEDN